MTADTIEYVIPAKEKTCDQTRTVWLVLRNGIWTREYIEPKFIPSPIIKP